ncbi:hypothetical protein EC99P1_00086 [Enterococcus phage EC99P1]|jgi:ribosomal protein S17E|nr:hypothetical protein EC55P1_00019 [Enterococcus phage EC55P1]WAX12575.1 hypothetical protein EC55P2_00085 [Enterococcus phage EC55P2]WAX12678.1 hypothetical protein EC99P1_00086 [Enterococcus phage EC99P1]
MGRVRVDIIKKVDFDKLIDHWLDETERAMEKNTMQMRQAVKYNIQANGNIDTSTMISDIETETKVSSGGRISYGIVKSNVSGNPKGHRGYAPIVERYYPNFIPALEDYTEQMVEKLMNINL